MKNARLIIDSALAATILLLGAIAWSQTSRLDDLEEQLARVQATKTLPRVARQAAEPAPAAPDEARSDAAPTSVADAPTRKAEIQEADPVLVPHAQLDTDDPVVRSKLRDVIDEARQEERAQRWQQRQERREERIRERMQEFAKQQDLDEDTEMQVTDLLVVEQLEVSELFRAAREDGSWDQARQKSAEVRKQTDEKVNDLLTDEQFAIYEVDRNEEADGWPGGRGPRRGGGGGRGPANR